VAEVDGGGGRPGEDVAVDVFAEDFGLAVAVEG
jgi:hypothetical protein